MEEIESPTEVLQYERKDSPIQKNSIEFIDISLALQNDSKQQYAKTNGGKNNRLFYITSIY